MPAAAAYIRVSSRAQNHATQRAAIERAAQARGDTIDTWYAEKLSGKSTDRPELHRLREDARAGHIGKLYLFRIDRLTRSGIRDTFEVVEELRLHGVKLVTVADGFDLEGPAAEVVLAVIAWAAKMERLAINERISAARERLAEEGRRWGRPSKLTPQERERIVELRDQGLSHRQIAQTMHIKRSTVTLSLKRTAAEAA